jgi:dihydrofolate reductase
VNKIKNAEFFAKENDYKELMILGGGNVYAQIIDDADKIYITRVHHVFEDADTFFPVIDEKKWKLVSNEDHFKDDSMLMIIAFSCGNENNSDAGFADFWFVSGFQIFILDFVDT